MEMLQFVLIILALFVAFAVIFESYKRKKRLAKIYDADDAPHVSTESKPQQNKEILEQKDAQDFSDLGIIENSRPIANENDPYETLIPDVDITERIKLAKEEDTTVRAESSETETLPSDEYSEAINKNSLFAISFYLIADESYPFHGYDLYQTLSMIGLTYGKMHIFHYLNDGETLFSLASGKEPGSFDLDDMGEWSCEALSLFMQVSELKNPLLAFDQMLKVAKALQDELGGQLMFDKTHQLSSDHIAEYRRNIRDHLQNNNMECTHDTIQA